MVNALLERLRREPLLFASLILACGSSLFIRPRLQAVDWPVLIALFNLMVALGGLDRVGVFDAISLSLLRRVRRERGIGLILVGSTFFASMLITNDVALLTFVPLTILVARRASSNPAFIIILQTIAANVGSSLTPVGNPQNLFLYATYNVPLPAFLRTTLPFVATGSLWLLALLLLLPREERSVELPPSRPLDRSRMSAWFVLFAVVLFWILWDLPQGIALVLTVVAALAVDRQALKKVDYTLLGIFIALFIFVDNLARVPAVAAWMEALLTAPRGTYVAGVAFSQVVSNVPAALLLAGFTDNWGDLLLGVSVGGLGTLIASMASVISYRLYVRAYPDEPYLARFHGWNVLSLVLLGGAVWLLT